MGKDLYRRIWGEAPPERDAPSDRRQEPSDDGVVGELTQQIEGLREELEAMAGEMSARLRALEGRLEEALASSSKTNSSDRKKPRAPKEAEGIEQDAAARTRESGRNGIGGAIVR